MGTKKTTNGKPKASPAACCGDRQRRTGAGMMVPSAVPLLLSIPGGVAVAQGLRSLGQFVEPSSDPESAGRYLLEILTAQSVDR